MAKQHRKVLKRKVAQTYNHLQTAVNNLAWLAEVFEEDHPEYDAAWRMIGTTIVLAMGELENISRHAWGTFPDDIDTWMH